MSSSERTGILILRARVDDAAPTSIRVELRGTHDLDRDLSAGLVLDDVEAVCVAVRAWLETLLVQ